MMYLVNASGDKHSRGLKASYMCLKRKTHDCLIFFIACTIRITQNAARPQTASLELQVFSCRVHVSLTSQTQAGLISFIVSFKHISSFKVCVYDSGPERWWMVYKELVGFNRNHLLYYMYSPRSSTDYPQCNFTTNNSSRAHVFFRYSLLLLLLDRV